VTPAEHELLEVRRAFEKFGFGDLLIAADGTVAPHLGVLRVLAFLTQDIDRVLALRRFHQIGLELQAIVKRKNQEESPMPDAVAREETRVANLTLEEACAELSAAVYNAAQLVEQLEGQGKVIGNGHHARQSIASFAVEDLKARWAKKG
jgi:hypothetical protein